MVHRMIVGTGGRSCLRLILSMATATCVSVAIVGHLRGNLHHTAVKWGLLIGLALLLAPAVRWLWFGFAETRLRGFSPRARGLWLLASLLVGGFLTVAIPIPFPYPLRHYTVAITATGQKNAERGSEVVFYGIYDPAGKFRVSPKEFVVDDGWDVKDSRTAVSYRQQPGTMRWSGLAPWGSQLRFGKFWRNGIVTVVVDGKAESIDLFDATGAVDKDVCLTPTGEPPANTKAFFIFAADGISLGLVCFLMSVWLATRPASVSGTVVSRWAWLGYALPTALVAGYYLWAFWPGLMTVDSFAQWDEITTGKYDDWHPVCNTLTNWLITRYLVLAGGDRDCANHGAQRHRRFQPGLDAAERNASLACNRHLFDHGLFPRQRNIRCYGLEGHSLRHSPAGIGNGRHGHREVGRYVADAPHFLAVVGAGGVAVGLYRHNGTPVAAAVLLILPLAYRQYWRPLVLSLVIFVGVFAAVKGPLCWALKARPCRSLKAGPMLHHIGAHLAAKTPLAPEEREFLNRILPLDKNNAWPFDAYYADCIIWNKKLDHDFVSDHIPRVTGTFISLSLRRPSVNLQLMKETLAACLANRMVPRLHCDTVVR